VSKTRPWTVIYSYREPAHLNRCVGIWHVFASCGHEAVDWVRSQVRQPMSVQKVRLMTTVDWLDLLKGVG
jgi:hypothetical protein